VAMGDRTGGALPVRAPAVRPRGRRAALPDLAPRSLGLDLPSIAAVLDGDGDGLEETLPLQLAHVEEQVEVGRVLADRLGRALAADSCDPRRAGVGRGAGQAWARRPANQR